MPDRLLRPAIARGYLYLTLLSAAAICLVGVAGAGEPPQFTSPIDNGPLEVKLLPGEKITEQVRKFYDTGEDPYKGDAQALADGKSIYEMTCQACHMPDGSGRIGPSLIGDAHHYPRFTTDKGIFEIIYGGGTGAMQPFGKRLTQDKILRVMAYVRSLKK
ncbi:MAG: c-type cytochrome [Xanthobacteraceae bacterium]